MNKITFEKIWFDCHMLEIRIIFENKKYKFITSSYENLNWFKKIFEKLKNIKDINQYETISISVGEISSTDFGSFIAVFKVTNCGVVQIKIQMKSEPELFNNSNMQSEFITITDTEPALIDNFASDLKEVIKGNQKYAMLELRELK